MKARPQHFDTHHLHLLPERRKQHNVLGMWHLLSLDAPTVATVWTVFVARNVGMRLPWSAPVAMFLAVWMLYAADRLLDARMSALSELELRHHFHHRHRIAFVEWIVVCSLGLAWLTPTFLVAALRLYALLGVLLGTYFFLIHLGKPGAVRLPKELAVGVFFPAGVFIPTVARVPSLRLHLLPEAFLFAAVCSLNCLYVYAWEHKAPYAQAHWSTRVSVRWLATLTVSVFVASLGMVVVHGSLVALATGASALLLLSLDLLRGRLSALHLRALADFVLLTPLLVPVFWR